jgi:hypothetical protein
MYRRQCSNSCASDGAALGERLSIQMVTLENLGEGAMGQWIEYFPQLFSCAGRSMNFKLPPKKSDTSRHSAAAFGHFIKIASASRNSSSNVDGLGTDPWHRLNFFPLPHGHGAFLPGDTIDP